jgi:hypothetical protein
MGLLLLGSLDGWLLTIDGALGLMNSLVFLAFFIKLSDYSLNFFSV